MTALVQSWWVALGDPGLGGSWATGQGKWCWPLFMQGPESYPVIWSSLEVFVRILFWLFPILKDLFCTHDVFQEDNISGQNIISFLYVFVLKIWSLAWRRSRQYWLHVITIITSSSSPLSLYWRIHCILVIRWQIWSHFIMGLHHYFHLLFKILNIVLKIRPLAWRRQRRLRLWIAKKLLQRVFHCSKTESLFQHHHKPHYQKH